MSFPDSNGYGWRNGDERPIHHVLLTITDKENAPDPIGGVDNGNLPDDSLIFALKQYRTTRVASTWNLTEVVGSLIDNPEFPIVSRLASPYDISVGRNGRGEQAWVIIELDGNINWRYTPDMFGISEKDTPLPNGANFYLRHLRKVGDQWVDSRRAHDDNCRVLVFGVSHRGGRNTQSPNDNGSCFVNLHVEFYQDEKVEQGSPNRVPTKFLRIIIDPDVKNEGPDEFP